MALHWEGLFQDEATKKITTANPKVVESMKWLADFSKSIGTDSARRLCGGLRRQQLQRRQRLLLDWPKCDGVKRRLEGQPGQEVQAGCPVWRGALPRPQRASALRELGGRLELGVPKGAKNPEAAWRVVSWVCGPEGQDMFCKATYHIPTNQTDRQRSVL